MRHFLGLMTRNKISYITQPSFTFFNKQIAIKNLPGKKYVTQESVSKPVLDYCNQIGFLIKSQRKSFFSSIKSLELRGGPIHELRNTVFRNPQNISSFQVRLWRVTTLDTWFTTVNTEKWDFFEWISTTVQLMKYRMPENPEFCFQGCWFSGLTRPSS